MRAGMPSSGMPLGCGVSLRGGMVRRTWPSSSRRVIIVGAGRGARHVAATGVVKGVAATRVVEGVIATGAVEVRVSWMVEVASGSRVIEGAVSRVVKTGIAAVVKAGCAIVRRVHGHVAVVGASCGVPIEAAVVSVIHDGYAA